MYSTKCVPQLKGDGLIKPSIYIHNGILYVNDKHRFMDGKWFSRGEDAKWYFLGFGANPCIVVDDKNIINRESFDGVFEFINNEEQGEAVE